MTNLAARDPNNTTERTRKDDGADLLEDGGNALGDGGLELWWQARI